MATEKYVISLDPVDIILLPVNSFNLSKYENVSPPWTRSNLYARNTDYYEFEIKNIDNTQQDDNPEDEIVNILCHICNIEVPVPYLKQHHDSFKHEINMKIADTAMERIKRSMHDHNVSNEETYPTLHFCAACVTVIKLKDQTKHERSIVHRNSLTINKFLNDFYLFYTNYGDNVHKDGNMEDLKQFNDIKKEVINDEVDDTIDSVSFKSSIGSSFKENEIYDRKDNHDHIGSTNDYNMKTINISPDKIKSIHNNKDMTSNLLPINYSHSVEDKNKKTVDNATEKGPNGIVPTGGSKKNKAKTITQGIELISKDENDNNRQTHISLSSVDDDMKVDVPKHETVGIRKSKTKKAKTKNKEIVQALKDKHNNIDALSFISDDTTVDDDSYTFSEIVKIENSKFMKGKTKMNQNTLRITKDPEDNGSTFSLSFIEGDTMVKEELKENNKMKKEKSKINQNSKHDKDSPFEFSFIGDDLTFEYPSKVSEVVKMENSKKKKGKKKHKDIENKNKSNDSLSFFGDDITVEYSSKNILDVIKTENELRDKKSKEKYEIEENIYKSSEIETCIICNDRENEDHLVCIFLMEELSERFEPDHGIYQEINNLYYHLVIKHDIPFCMVCKVQFYGNKNVITHLFSSCHINNYQMLISEHFLISDNNMITCLVCDVKFKKAMELLHCEGIKHITKQEIYKKQLGRYG